MDINIFGGYAGIVSMIVIVLKICHFCFNVHCRSKCCGKDSELSIHQGSPDNSFKPNVIVV